MSTRVPGRRDFLVAAGGAAFAGLAAAQGFAAKAVKIVVPYAAGGGLDLVARVVGERMSRELRQPVIVDNRPGANGVLATEAVARSAADGNTLVMGVPATLAINPNLYKLSFDPQKDLQAIAQLALAHFVLVTASSSGITSLVQLVAEAKAHPGKYSFASYGNGSAPHLAGQMLRNLAGADLVHVPYKGSNAAMPDVLSGRVSVMFDVVANVQPQVQAGALRVLAAAGRTVPPQFPQAPLASSVLPGLALDGWVGLFGPSGMPAAVVERLQGAAKVAMADPALAQRLTQLGFDVQAAGPDAMQQTVRRDTVAYAAVIRSAGLKIE